MTNEQAIAMISHIKEYIVDNQGDQEYGGALDMAIEALEKQIPKKPKYGRQGPDDYVICPQCGFLGLDEFQPCCGECGQHIDWPEQEV